MDGHRKNSVDTKGPPEGQSGQQPSPCCLPTHDMEAFAEIIGEKLHQHFERKGIEALYRRIPRKKGPIACRQNSYEELAERANNLPMAWIDYKKAFDMVTHSWIPKCLEFL